ncbi:MAG: N-6 DNA methylase [Bacilli bacterium]|nr:N-6 DNA methylase [Bacilli bacterium]
MPIEQFTEKLTKEMMGVEIGQTSFGYVYPQGDVPHGTKLYDLLKKCGGKPTECELSDFSTHGGGKAKPEFIITFNSEPNTVVVVECKNSPSKHSTPDFNHPKDYACDGVLYYAKYLKEEFNVIAVAISGTKVENLKVDTYEWHKGRPDAQKVQKGKDVILEAENYIQLYKGEKIRRKFSLEEIRNTALEMHNTLREVKVTEKQKPIFIAGILIALNDSDFVNDYENLTSFNYLINALMAAIDKVLDSSDIKREKIDDIKRQFRIIKTNEKLKDIPLDRKGSLKWYVEQLEMKIKPMMDHTENTLDALGIFYHEFVKYSGGDGSGLGIVLTPQHLTEFMCEVAGVNKNSRVVDICCGSGSFLVTAMGMMFKQANATELERIRKDSLYGVELDGDLFTLAITNMIIRKDGKSNIYNTDCFKADITQTLKDKHLTIGLMNPPYSQKDICELEFVEHLLEILEPNGKACVVVPMSCAIGTKFKEVRERLFAKHTLKAVFSMPDDIFYPTGTNVCVMLWEAHAPHNKKIPTFFGFCKDDGFVKRKKLGRVDANRRWNDIKNRWLELFRTLDVKDGESALECVDWNNEWLCEAYMKTDYSTLTEFDFEQTIRDFYSYKIKNGGN